MEEKHPCQTKLCAFIIKYAWFRDIKMINFEVSNFLENYITSEGVVSHKDLYYQQLSITRHQEKFYVILKHFE